MRALVIVAVLAAPAAAGVLEPARHYAALFELNHAWTYDVAMTTWDPDVEPDAHGHMKKKTVKSVVNCAITQVARFSTAFISELHCDDDLPIAGFYAATSAGLFRIPAWVHIKDDLPELDTPLIAAAPKVFRKKTHDDFFKADYIQGVKRKGTAWCIYDDSSGFADGGPTSTCFDKGIASGFDDTGGELHRVDFTAR